MSEKRKTFNKRSIIIELAIVLGVALIVLIVRFLPWLMEQPVPGYDPWSQYMTLINAVDEYDYSKGKDAELEKRLVRATESIGSDPVQYYYNQKAKALYYYRVADFEVSITALDNAISFAPNPIETGAAYDLYIKNYTALNRPEDVKKYRGLHDALPI